MSKSAIAEQNDRISEIHARAGLVSVSSDSILGELSRRQVQRASDDVKDVNMVPRSNDSVHGSARLSRTKEDGGSGSGSGSGWFDLPIPPYGEIPKSIILGHPDTADADAVAVVVVEVEVVNFESKTRTDIDLDCHGSIQMIVSEFNMMQSDSSFAAEGRT